MKDEVRSTPGGRRNPPGGAPTKGNTKLVCYVKPATLAAIETEKHEKEPMGEALDRIIQRIEQLKLLLDMC